MVKYIRAYLPYTLKKEQLDHDSVPKLFDKLTFCMSMSLKQCPEEISMDILDTIERKIESHANVIREKTLDARERMEGKENVSKDDFNKVKLDAILADSEIKKMWLEPHDM